MPLNTLQCTGQPLTTKNYLSQDVHTGGAEKPYSKTVTVQQKYNLSHAYNLKFSNSYIKAKGKQVRD